MSKSRIAVAALTMAGIVGIAAMPAHADEGAHLGQLGQACTAGYGFSSLGAGIHSVVVDTGNFAGGVPQGLATYCS